MKDIQVIEPSQNSVQRRKRVAAYARVSVATDPLLHSIEAQISYYSKLIQSNPEWEYAGVFADKGISGTGIKKRDAFQAMLESCEKGEIDIFTAY